MNISKCFQTGRIEKDEMKEICARIVQTASSYVDPNLQAKLRHVIYHATNETLKHEHEALRQINMKWVYLDYRDWLMIQNLYMIIIKILLLDLK